MENHLPFVIGFSHTGTAYYSLLRERAKELAVLNGRASNNPSGADLAQAREELTSNQATSQTPNKKL